MDNSQNTLFPECRKPIKRNDSDQNFTSSDSAEDSVVLESAEDSVVLKSAEDSVVLKSAENSKNSRSLSVVPECKVPEHKQIENKKLEPFLNKFILSLCIVVFAAVAFQFLDLLQNVNNPEVDLKAVEESIKKENIDIWNSLSAVVGDVLKHSSKLGVFLFLYTEKSSRLKETIEPIINYTSAKLKTFKHVEIEAEEFHTENAYKDYGHLIVKYKPELEQKRVMVVKNLQNIPPNVAQIFQTFCDEINPQVHPAIFILTLKVDSLEGNEISIADEVFERIWKELGTDTLSPLIARIRNSVFKIH